MLLNGGVNMVAIHNLLMLLNGGVSMVAILQFVDAIEWWSKLMVAILQFVDAIEWWSKLGSYPSIC